VVPEAIVHAAQRLPHTCLLLWYPVKSLTRPNAMHARLEAAGVPAVIAELVTTSLKHQRNRLNGSGVLLVRPPRGTLEALAAAAPVIGRCCATRAGAWSFRMHAW
jgi:23S rRNA A2030 N6-methylase RlmJ